MANELTKVQNELLFNSGYTGISTGSSMVYPPVVNILQSDKQFKAFGDADISTKLYGKLFVRTEINKPEDLVDEVVGTAIKIEMGYEVRDEQKVIASGEGMLSPEQKTEYEEQGYKALNMTKILLAIGTPEEVSKQMDIYSKKLSEGSATSADFPFALLPIKGSSWGSWIEAQSMMQELSRREYGHDYRDTIASLYKLSVKSEKQYSSKYGDFYSFVVGIELNDPDTAAKFAPVIMAMRDFSLFNEVAKRIEKKDPLEVDFDKM
jgi:hypothetical protein